MRVLLISDVHSNLVALRAVLADAKRRGGWDVVWNMGDIVGYGPEPAACLDILGELGGAAVAGNHDWAVVKKVPLTEFNYAAALANRWTADQLSPAQMTYLEDLPLTYELGEFTLVHGSPRDPIWEYLVDGSDAIKSFGTLTTPHAAVGHTHMAAAFGLDAETGECRKLALTMEQTLRLHDGRWIINPGSVGQPRDGDPRAAYAIVEYPEAIVTAYRVEYDIAATQQRMTEVGLPLYLADRLTYGR